MTTYKKLNYYTLFKNHFYNAYNLYNRLNTSFQYLLVGSNPLADGHRRLEVSPAFVGGQHRKVSNVQLQYTVK